MGMSESEFAAKIEWEGGILAALEYGLRQDDLESPNCPLGERWHEAQRIFREKLQPAIAEIEELLPEEAW